MSAVNYDRMVNPKVTKRLKGGELLSKILNLMVYNQQVL